VIASTKKGAKTKVISAAVTRQILTALNVAIRYDAWRAVFLENRGVAIGVWCEPFTELRMPLLFNLRRDPFERVQHNANTYNDWFLDRVFVLVPMQQFAAKFLVTMKDYPPSRTPGIVQSAESAKADQIVPGR
jgi:hypothetical protein